MASCSEKWYVQFPLDVKGLTLRNAFCSRTLHVNVIIHFNCNRIIRPGVQYIYTGYNTSIYPIVIDHRGFLDCQTQGTYNIIKITLLGLSGQSINVITSYQIYTTVLNYKLMGVTLMIILQASKRRQFIIKVHFQAYRHKLTEISGINYIYSHFLFILNTFQRL